MPACANEAYSAVTFRDRSQDRPSEAAPASGPGLATFNAYIATDQAESGKSSDSVRHLAATRLARSNPIGPDGIVAAPQQIIETAAERALHFLTDPTNR